MEIKKYIKNGKVAVLYSPGFGAGWSTWNSSYVDNTNELIFCPELAKAIDRGAKFQELEQIAMRLFPEAYLGGLTDLTIAWISEGTEFEIYEYDGSESIRYNSSNRWKVA